MEFDMNRTWTQGIALVKANLQLLAVIAGVFMLLPGTLLYVALPDFTALALQPNDDPEQVAAMFADMAGPLIGFGLITFLLQLVGYMAMMALMGTDRPTVRQALSRSLVSLPTTIALSILILLVYIVATLVVSVIFGVIATALAAAAGTGVTVIVSFLMVFGILFILLYLAARLTMAVPVVILEGERNPFTAFARSLSLTKGHAKKIFLFYLLLIVCYFVFSLIIGAVFGLVAVAFAQGTGSSLVLGLVNGLIGAAAAMIFSGLLVSMHQQLAGTDSATIKQTFE